MSSILFLAATLLVSTLETERLDLPKRKCTDGRVLTVPKNPAKGYKPYTKQSDTKVKAAINVMDKVRVEGLDFATKNEVVELREKLNQLNSTLQLLLQASFQTYCVDPCENRVSHNNLMSELSKEMLALERLRMNLTSAVASGGIGGQDVPALKRAISTYNQEKGEFNK